MVGMIDNSRMFEFRTNDELVAALDFWASKYDDNVVIISNSSDKVLACIKDGELTFEITESWLEGTDYFLRRYTLPSRVDIDLPGRNEVLEGQFKNADYKKLQFYLCIRKVIVVN